MSDSAVLILCMTVMLVACLAFALIPLWRRRAITSGHRRLLSPNESNLALWREQRAELERDRDRGELSDEEYERSISELALRAAPELTNRQHARSESIKRPWALGIAVLVVTVAVSTLVYWNVGAFREVLAPPAASAGPQITAAQVNAMVEQLGAKLKQDPSDAKGWELMAHAQSALGHFDLAVPAYEKVMALRTPDAQLLADYADADAMLHDHSLVGRPTASIDRALQLDPSNAKALELAGTAALDRRDVAATIGYWTRLQTLLPEGSEDRAQVDEALRQLRGGSPQASRASAAPLESAPRTMPSANNAGSGKSTVSGQIEIAPELLDKVTLSDTVFIFARALDGAAGQPRMPLAVMRVAAKELPRAFELTDAMAMSPGLNLSGASKVVVIARISKSGSAEARSGDLEGSSMPVGPGTSGLQVKIDHVVP